MKCTDNKLRKLPGKDMILLLENKIRGVIGSVMGDRYVKPDEKKKTLHVDAKNFFFWVAMSQSLPYDEVKFDREINLEDILNTPNDSDFGHSLEVDLSYLEERKEKTKNFLYRPENKKFTPDVFTPYMNKNKSSFYTQTKKLILYWTDKKNVSFIIGC